MPNDSILKARPCAVIGVLLAGAFITTGCSTDSGGGGDCAPGEIHCTSGSQCQSGACGSDACCAPLQSSTSTCTTTADCPVGMVCMNATCQTALMPDAGNPGNNNDAGLLSCQQDSDCAIPLAPYCLAGTCVGCTNPSQCPLTAPVCDDTTNSCVGCSSDIACVGLLGDHCDTNSGACVGCLQASDCSGGKICLSNEFCGPCSEDSDCPSGDSCTAGLCVAPPPDAGAGSDAGASATDAGTSGADAGTTGTDAGRGSQDAGTEPSDAGGAGSCAGGCSGQTPVCDTASGLCVQCLKSSDCPDSETCYAGLCATTTECTYDTESACSSTGACTAVPAASGEDWELRCVDSNAGGALGGSACLSDSDCLSTNCLLFLGSAGTPVDGICIDACGTGYPQDCASKAQCPGKVLFGELPGSTSGSDVYIPESICWAPACTNDAACAGTGAGGANRICSLTPGDLSGSSSSATVTSWVEACLPAVGAAAAGATCSADSDCATGVCLPSGKCFGACAMTSDCTGSNTCKASELTNEAGTTIKTCAP